LRRVKLLSIKNAKAFEYVNKEAIKYTCRFFVVYLACLPSDFEILSNKSASAESAAVLYGFKISRKYGNSVSRNLLKRRLKNIYLNYFQENYHPVAITFIPRKEITNLDFTEIKMEIFKAINWLIKNLEKKA